MAFRGGLVVILVGRYNHGNLEATNITKCLARLAGMRHNFYILHLFQDLGTIQANVGI